VGDGLLLEVGGDMARMKTIRVEEFGETDVLQYVDVERPEPGEGRSWSRSAPPA
jgi:hypothetical protein